MADAPTGNGAPHAAPAADTASSAPAAESWSAPCVHCGFCLPACPTYDVLGTEMDGPRGRLHLMDALQSGRAQPTPALLRHLDTCLGCRACESACPSGVAYGERLEETRASTRDASRGVFAGPAWLRRALLRGAASPAWLVHAGVVAVSAAQRWLPTLTRRVARKLGPGAEAGLEVLARRRPRRTRLPSHARPERAPKRRVALLLGCLHRPLSASLHEATHRMLLRAGCEVVVPPRQGCCGALARHLGELDEARARVAALLDDLAAVGRLDHVVVNAAGCGASLREAQTLWPPGHPRHAEAASLAARSVDALVLLDELGLPPARRDVKRRVALHHACHLVHAQGVRAAPERLLASIPGLRLEPLADADRCCGSAGVYNLLQPELAGVLRDQKVAACRASGAEVIAAANPGCQLQIEAGLAAAGLGLGTTHPIELLDEAHRA